MKVNTIISAFSFIASIAIAQSAAAAENGVLAKGRKFPLSDRVIASLVRVEVQRISSDNTIDIAVVLDRDDGPKRSPGEIVAELGEFCLRYQSRIVSAAVPAAERSKINLFAPLYQASTGKSTLTQEAGFGFPIHRGQCSLDPPFPANLVNQTRQNAKLPVDR